MRIFCRQDPRLNMAVRGDKVVLVRADNNDKSQHWFKDEDAVGKLTDDQGRKAFALVNRATEHAMVNNDNTVVKLAPYSGHVAVELSMMWSLGMQLPDGYAEIRTLRDLSLTLNGINGRVREGTVVGMYDSEPDSDNAIWKIEPIME